MKVKAIHDYFDLELNRAVKRLEEFEVSDARAKTLSTKDNKAGIPLVEVVKPAPAKKKKAAAKK